MTYSKTIVDRIIASAHDNAELLDDMEDNSLLTEFNRKPATADNFQKIEDHLRRIGLTIGTIMGSGGSALIFNLHNLDGEVLPEVVARMSLSGSNGYLNNPGILQPLHYHNEGNVELLLFPKANVRRTVSERDVARTMSILAHGNGGQELHDLGSNQFLWVGDEVDMPMPLLCDSGCIKNCRSTEHILARTFHDFSRDLSDREAPIPEFSHIDNLQLKLASKALALKTIDSLKARGVHTDKFDIARLTGHSR